MEALADSLRQAWADADASVHDPSGDAAARDRWSWVWLPSGPATDAIDGLPLPQAEMRERRLQGLSEQRADLARYESRDLAGVGGLPDWLARFYRNVARGRPSRTPEDAVELTANPPAVRFGPADAGATTTLEVRGNGAAESSLRFLAPAGHWFDLIPAVPGQAPDAGGSIHLAAAPSVRVPLRIGLRPDHDAAAPPAGIVAEVRVGGLAYHRLIPVSLLAITDRLEVFVSAYPAGATALDELRLRPFKGRQAYSLFIRNLSVRPRNLIVRLADADGPIPGGEARISLREHETLPVRFVPAASASKSDAAPTPPTPTPGAAGAVVEADLPELKGPLEVRLLDADAGDAAAEVKTIPVEDRGSGGVHASRRRPFPSGPGEGWRGRKPCNRGRAGRAGPVGAALSRGTRPARARRRRPTQGQEGDFSG